MLATASRGRLSSTMLWVALASLAATACDGALHHQHERSRVAPQPSVRPPEPAKTASATAASSIAAAPAVAPVARQHLIAEGKPHALSLSLLPVQDKRWALLVAQRGERFFVKRLLADGPEEATRALGTRRPVMGLDGKRPWLLSSDGQRLCVEALDAPAPPQCRKLRPEGAGLLDGRVVLIEQRPDKPPATASAPATKPSGKPPRKGITPKRRKRRGARRGGARGGRRTRKLHQATDPKPLRMRVWLHRLDEEGRFEPKPIDTRLTFKRPLPGMGVVDAAAAGKRVSVLYFEHKGPRRDGRRRIPQARLRVAELDRRGRFIRRSKRTLYKGDRRYGYIDGHHRPQLFAHAGRVAMVGRFAKLDGGRMLVGFEAIGMRPWGVRSAPATAMSLDPWRVAGGPAIDKAARAALDALDAQRPVRAFGQPKRDAGRAAWVGDRAYYLCGEALCDIRGTAAPRRHERPFGATASPLSWASMDVAGRGLAATAEALVELRADGSMRRHAGLGTTLVSGGMAAVRIGDSWWQLQPRASSDSAHAVVRLLPSAAEAPDLAALAFPGSTALVGGARHGLLLSVGGGQLSSWRLHEDGRSEQGATWLAPLLSFEAVARQGGGALLAGITRQGGALSMALAPDGTRLQLWPLPGGLRVGDYRLQALPQGGALLYDRAGGRVLWLDQAGKPLQQLPSRPPRHEDGCEGWPLPEQVPGATPGTAVSRADLAGVADCGAHPIQPMADGSYRWFGRQQQGLTERARVVVSLPIRTTAKSDTKTLSSSPDIVQAGKRARRPCPPDMVYVAGAYCVDRYESRLLDRQTALPLSPNYPAEAGIVTTVLKAWAGGRFYEGDLHAGSLPLPPLLRPLGQTVMPRAFNRYGIVPSGYVSGYGAERACKAAGKRLCKRDEWKQACRGEQNRKFPYGDSYRQGVCNVHRYVHPAHELHGNTAVGHLDPRLNALIVAGVPLLRRSGETPACASRWGDDAIYDMVGNLDEWLDDKKGSFAGGFYSRATKMGCSARISAHPRRYVDYSLGVRCCADPQ